VADDRDELRRIAFELVCTIEDRFALSLREEVRLSLSLESAADGPRWVWRGVGAVFEGWVPVMGTRHRGVFCMPGEMGEAAFGHVQRFLPIAEGGRFRNVATEVVWVVKIKVRLANTLP